MAAYVVVQIGIHDPIRYERYKIMAPFSIATYGGRCGAGGPSGCSKEWQPARLVILEFRRRGPCLVELAEYAPAKAIRQACARTEMLLIEAGP
jgi:uncharacterized protein (DUF1330 family)